jgi:DNA helicase II / ATP-dependent DNA helicase PcrA
MEQKEFSFKDFLENDLNPEQQKAVKHASGPVLVIAGAGSGKTRVITARITQLLLEKDLHPAQLVALTFTNKAANEMKERIIKFMGSRKGIPFIGTFHSYCLYLLKTNTHLLPFDTFSILDEDDKRSIINKLLKQSTLHKRSTAQQIAYQISKLKNQIADPTQSPLDLIENPPLREIVEGYEREKKISQCYDFDDLLIEATRLFHNNKDLKLAHHNQVRHLLVDEYQDTNVIQHTLLKHMGLDEKKQLAVDSICVVGDEDQSIYSWRGATVDNIINFKKDFKRTKLIKIEQNYRSKQPILHVANTVITHNKKRNEKKLWSSREGSDCVRALQCLSGYQEADIIARYAKLLHTHKKLASTAILYRTHFQSRVLEEALLRHSIPYLIIGGIRFYERKEIKDLVAYLRLIVNPFDRVAFSRIVNCPSRGLGDVFQEQFLSAWDAEPLLNMRQVGEKLIKDKLFPPSKTESLQSFINVYNNLTPESPAALTLADVISKSGYLAHLKKSYEKNESTERQENIKELLNAAHFFASQGKTTVAAFLDEVTLLQEKADVEQIKEEGIMLMTIHAAKGLEFNNVIMAGLEENLFPSSRSLDTQEQLEEERRLFYVGITRAKNRLLLTNARYRQTYGQMEQQISSRFLDEVPTSACKFAQAQQWQQYEVNNFFTQWVGLRSTNPEVFTFAPPKSVQKQALQSKQATPKTNNVNAKFRKHQTIKHKTFGVGIVKDVEQKSSKVFVTAHFKAGTKKVEASFLDTV